MSSNIVFVQVDERYIEDLGEGLAPIMNKMGLDLVLLPLNTKILSKEAVRGLMKSLKEWADGD